MALRYFVHSQSLSPSQSEELLQNLKGFTFLACELANQPQSFDVVLNPEQTMDSVVKAFPALDKCRIELVG